jgi:hypothetical protein
MRWICVYSILILLLQGLTSTVRTPRGSVQKRPTGVSSKPANGSGPERLEVVPDPELAMQGKTGLFPQSSKKISLRRPQPRFFEVAHGSGHGFSDAEGSVGDLVLQLRGPHLRM